MIILQQTAVQPRSNRGKIGDEKSERRLGAAFADEDDIDSAQRVGIAYQISHFGPIDPVNETFGCQLQLSLLMEIDDADREAYEEARRESYGAEALQHMYDAGKVKCRPPPFEILNATSCDLLAARVAKTALAHNNDEKDEDSPDGRDLWRWHVQVDDSTRTPLPASVKRLCALVSMPPRPNRCSSSTRYGSSATRHSSTWTSRSVAKCSKYGWG